MARNQVRYFINADASGAVRGGREAEGSVRRLAKVSRELQGASSVLGTSLGIGLAGGAIIAGRKMIELASAAAETDEKFNVLLGSAGPAVRKEFERFAKVTGASKFALDEQGASIAALIRPLGLSEKAAGKMSTQVVELATDLSSFNNVPVADSLEALRAGLAGQVRPLRAYGVSLNQARIQAEALAIGLVKPVKDAGLVADARKKVELATTRLNKAIKDHGTTSEQAARAQLQLNTANRGLEKSIRGVVPALNARQKAEAVLSIIMKDTALAQGDATRTAGSFANQQRRLQNQLSDTATELGQKMLPAAISVVSALNTGVPATGRFIHAIGGLGTIISGAGGYLAFRKLASAAGGVTSAFGSAANSFGVFNIASRKLDIKATAKLIGVRGAARAAGNSLSALAGGPIGLAALAAGGLAIAVYQVVQSMKTLSGEARDAVNALAGLAGAQTDEEGASLAVKRAQVDAAAAHHTYNQAVRDQQKLEKSGTATKHQLRQATLNVREADLSWAEARNRLKGAEQASAAAHGQTAKAAGDLAKEFGGLSSKALAAATSTSNLKRIGAITASGQVDGAKATRLWVSEFQRQAAASDTLSGKSKSLAKEIGGVVTRLGHVPTKTETKVIVDGLAQGKTIAEINHQLDVLDGRTTHTTSYFDTIIETHRAGSNPPPKGPPPKGPKKKTAGGAFFGGPPNKRDDIDVSVSQGEAILNPQQIDMVGRDRVMAALSATGAQTIHAGGGFAGGGKPKKLSASERRQKEQERRQRIADRHQALLDNAKNRFGGLMSADDLLLAKAERTVASDTATTAQRSAAFADDAIALKSEQSHILARIDQIHRTRRKYKWLSASQKRDLDDEEASLIRQLTDIGGQLATGGGTGPGQPPSEPDPFALERATTAGFTAGLGRANAYVLGGSGDIGYGGADALHAAGSIPGATIPAVHIETVTFTNSPQNQGAIAGAGNSGNGLFNRGRLYSPRRPAAF